MRSGGCSGVRLLVDVLPFVAATEATGAAEEERVETAGTAETSGLCAWLWRFGSNFDVFGFGRFLRI